MYHFLALKPTLKREALPARFGGESASGRRVGFDSLGLVKDGEPVFGVSGEIHYARLSPDHWEEALYKAKAGGVNVISTYVFWIHHEEERGIFDFSGRRDLRRFVALCQKHGLYCILRIGPFCHGEARNGGLPDWLYGMPFRTRSTDAGFLGHVRRLYEAIAGQVQGLLFADDGPVIGIQLDNEYMHSSAIWECTRGTTDEYVFASDEGDAYIVALKNLCDEVGLRVPFYTCTAWGGAACAPDTCVPLWGGYAYMPWMIRRRGDEHPLSEEYIYRDARSRDCDHYHSYRPTYDPEHIPFACCEMGPGMQVAYQYRFIADPCSADGMANVKAGSGCNFVGYYMYHGGTNPGPSLGEDWCPRLSYDYQAPIGENLQPREAYYRLRALHQTFFTFGRELSAMAVSMPSGTVMPSDMESLRFSARSDGEAGFLFVNNFQDHAEMPAKGDIRFRVETAQGRSLHIPRDTEPPLAIASGESCVLPFGLPLLGARLEYATVQILFMQEGHLFCMRPEGMPARMDFGEYGLLRFGDADEETKRLSLPGGELTATVFSRAYAHQVSPVTYGGKAFAVWTDGEIYPLPGGLALHSQAAEMRIRTYPPGCLPEKVRWDAMEEKRLTIRIREGNGAPRTQEVLIPESALLRVVYEGDAARIFQNGRLVADHFFNGAPWDVPAFLLDLSEEIVLVIVPLKEDVVVSRDAMAAIQATAGSQHAGLVRLTPVPLYRKVLGEEEGGRG